jgi:hypothetical protein
LVDPIGASVAEIGLQPNLVLYQTLTRTRTTGDSSRTRLLLWAV